MRHHYIQITDSKKQAFLLEIWTPSGYTRTKFWKDPRKVATQADWSAVDQGYIRYTNGDALRYHSSGYTGADLYLGAPDSFQQDPFAWGIVLNSYDDIWGTNDAGTGLVNQPWVVGLEPGKIEWHIATNGDIAASALRRTGITSTKGAHP